MKNRRDVCMARDAGYTVYDNLPGAVKTGCMNSPEPNSRHCKLHRIRACNPSKDFIEDDAAPEVAESNDRVVEMILEKKITRKAVYYKVCILLIIDLLQCTWHCYIQDNCYSSK